MKQQEIEQWIQAIQNGNEEKRDEVIRYYESYIMNVVGKICRQYKTWNDDEASLGLIAFNRAIDTYQPEHGRTFLNYVYLLIYRELVDYFRKENRYQEIIDQQEHVISSQAYQQQEKKFELADEIVALQDELAPFSIQFHELESASPKHQRTRKKIFYMASCFYKEKELVDQLYQRKWFPMKSFIDKTGFRRKTIEKYRKYLIAVLIIWMHPEWRYLQSFVQKEGGVGDERS
ncbi:RNA polymerase sigma factor SigI [Gracilibacillus halophilus YIM-C55.5]|uniref:RNA polymerase sigma factor SigI n=1 Tax=Gracilibacillus halophilus YIM-C55.5 TaxID=1308866 RepID=N4WVI0_9BACI|nr:sigma factor [Gracilibacillus halophilus]ENH98405.1 RNA polymerase sigma factor SigI [Gracilibacillus halophilus YIM-C55.5]